MGLERLGSEAGNEAGIKVRVGCPGNQVGVAWE